MKAIPSFAEEITSEICRRIAEGENLRNICRDGHLPGFREIYFWMRTHPDFRANMKDAWECRARGYAEEIIEISDTAEPEETPSAINRARLKIETRKWLLSKQLPYDYGDRVEVTGQIDNQITLKVVRVTDQPADRPADIDIQAERI